MKTNRKVCLKWVKEYSRRSDLANEKYSSIFLGIFERIVKVTHFGQFINFCERAHGTTHPCKVDENNRKSTFFFFFFIFVF